MENDAVYFAGQTIVRKILCIVSSVAEKRLHIVNGAMLYS